MQLQIDRLLLREFAANDWRDVHTYASDPEIFRFRSSRPSATPEETRERLQRIIGIQQQSPRPEYFLAVVLRAENQLIGEVFLRLASHDTGEPFIGYTLNRADWGKGYMTEAAQAILDFGLTTLRLPAIVARCSPENIASWRVMEKIGMRREAVTSEHLDYRIVRLERL